jgi:hypothetical protein
MKSYRLLLSVILFTSFFLMSWWVGHQIGTRTRIAIAASAEQIEQSIKEHPLRLKFIRRAGEISKTPMYTPLSQVNADLGTRADHPQNTAIPARQRNLLIIGVDDLRAKSPRLISVWMIFYLLDTPHFMLVPIYPTTHSGGFDQPFLDESLSNTFQLDPEQAPGAEFLQSLHAKDLWWSGYIILDQTALDAIRKFVGGKVAKSNLNHPLSSRNIPDPQQDTRAALIGQARFAQDLCGGAAGLFSIETSQILDLFTRLSSHVRTDLDLQQAIEEIQFSLRNGGGVSCEFPSLEAQTAQP